jgi:hypothetical protein
MNDQVTNAVHAAEPSQEIPKSGRISRQEGDGGRQKGPAAAAGRQRGRAKPRRKEARQAVQEPPAGSAGGEDHTIDCLA